METTISVQGKNIQLEIGEHKIKLPINTDLTDLLANNTEASTDALVTAIKAAFNKQNNREIEVSNNSMAVEIWGHVYTESFANAVKSISTFKIIDGVLSKIIAHCEVIDIGEPGHDKNRFVWDMLAHFKSDIGSLLPKTNR